jgi:putative endonuclease
VEKQPCVYILASKRNGTLYVGVTSDLVKRVYEHKHDLADGFTKAYKVHCLVYFELHQDMNGAITREKQIKKWNRGWKLELIEKENPAWTDLYESIV